MADPDAPGRSWCSWTESRSTTSSTTARPRATPPGGPWTPVDLATAVGTPSKEAALFAFHDDRLAFHRFVAPQAHTPARVAVPSLFLFIPAGIVFFRMGLVRPVNRVPEGLRRVAAGDLVAEVTITEPNDLACYGKRARVPDFTCTDERDPGDDVGAIEVMPQEIGRVLLNLPGNAFDAVRERRRANRPEPSGEGPSRDSEAGRAMGEKGNTTWEWPLGDGTPDAADTRRDTTCRVQVSTRPDRDRVEIRVADNGPGIPEKIQDRIFEPFFTTKPTGSGTG